MAALFSALPLASVPPKMKTLPSKVVNPARCRATKAAGALATGTQPPAQTPAVQDRPAEQAAQVALPPVAEPPALAPPDASNVAAVPPLEVLLPPVAPLSPPLAEPAWPPDV